jgi:hypothetical protein
LIQRIETSGSVQSVTALEQSRTQWYHLVNDLIVQLDSAGQTATSDPELAARALLGIIRGVLRFTPQPWPSHLADWIYRQFMYGVASGEGPGARDEQIAAALRN